MLSPAQITTFNDAEPPPGESPWVDGARPSVDVHIVDPDPAWPATFEHLAQQIRDALGDRARSITHVGSTSVPGLPAKPIIDLDLIVADARDEAAYVPALESCGYALVVREPWWYEHRCLRHEGPAANLHVWSPQFPEAARHVIFRDWLRSNPEDRDLYAAAKAAAAQATRASGGTTTDYNATKQALIREIYARAFRANGLLD